MVCSVIYFTLIDFAVTLVMGNSYSTAAKIIQAGKNSLMNENQQGNTQKRKYRNIFDIALSAQVSLSSFWAYSYLVNCVGSWMSGEEGRQRQNRSTTLNNTFELMGGAVGFEEKTEFCNSVTGRSQISLKFLLIQQNFVIIIKNHISLGKHRKMGLKVS